MVLSFACLFGLLWWSSNVDRDNLCRHGVGSCPQKLRGLDNGFFNPTVRKGQGGSVPNHHKCRRSPVSAESQDFRVILTFLANLGRSCGREAML